jgi:hypothetical protein
VWQIMLGELPTGDIFDDGAVEQPGDENFSTQAVRDHVAALGAAADGFNYVGRSAGE